MSRLGFDSPVSVPVTMAATGYVWWPSEGRYVQRTGLVDQDPVTREDCYQHYEYDTCTGMKWPIPDGNAHPMLPPPSPVNPGSPPGGMLRGLDPRAAIVENKSVDCDPTTVARFALFAAVGAFAAKRGSKTKGAIDGIWGSWMGCAVAKALGSINAGIASTAFSVAGAWFVAKTFDGK